jgi:hypothetical protein
MSILTWNRSIKLTQIVSFSCEYAWFLLLNRDGSQINFIEKVVLEDDNEE